MTKKTYRFLRRFGTHAAGEEAELTEVEAIRIDNEAPGTIEQVEEPVRATSDPPQPPKEKP